MSNRVALLLEQVMIETEPETPAFVFECDRDATATNHYFCNPLTCIEAAMQTLTFEG